MALYLNFFVALLAISNPLGKVPLWLAAARDETSPVEWRLAILVVLTGGAILAIFLVFGRPLLAFFGIDLASFRVGGGIVVLLVGIRMLRGELVRLDYDLQQEQSRRDYLGQAKARFSHVMVPLVVPFVAGPASISTAVIYGEHAGSVIDYVAMLTVLGVIMLITLAVLLGARKVEKWLGTLLQVQTRLFGLVLAAVAAQFILTGIGHVFPVLVSPDSPLADDIQRAEQTGRAQES